MSKEAYAFEPKEVDESGGLRVVDAHPVKRDPWWKFGGNDVSFVSVDAGYAKVAESASSSDTKLNEPLGQHVWETEESREIYKPIEGYEGAHRFKPGFQWEPEEERKLVRQVTRDVLLALRFIHQHGIIHTGELLGPFAPRSSEFFRRHQI